MNKWNEISDEIDELTDEVFEQFLLDEMENCVSSDVWELIHYDYMMISGEVKHVCSEIYNVSWSKVSCYEEL